MHKYYFCFSASFFFYSHCREYHVWCTFHEATQKNKSINMFELLNFSFKKGYLSWNITLYALKHFFVFQTLIASVQST